MIIIIIIIIISSSSIQKSVQTYINTNAQVVTLVAYVAYSMTNGRTDGLALAHPYQEKEAL